MAATCCHAEVLTPRAAAKAWVYEVGTSRVAHWCGVGDCAIYKWFERATDDEPVPAKYVPKILAGARRDGFAVDPRLLMPSLPVLP